MHNLAVLSNTFGAANCSILRLYGSSKAAAGASAAVPAAVFLAGRHATMPGGGAGGLALEQYHCQYWFGMPPVTPDYVLHEYAAAFPAMLQAKMPYGSKVKLLIVPIITCYIVHVAMHIVACDAVICQVLKRLRGLLLPSCRRA